jgi:hypothetical protein
MNLPDLEQLLDNIAPDSRASRRKKRKNVSDSDDTSTDDVASKKAKAQEQWRRDIMLNLARLPNGLEMELPVEEDFSGFHAVPRRRYYGRIQQLREQINSEDPRVPPKSLKAPRPWVPDPTSEDISFHHYSGESEENEENDGVSHDFRAAWNNGRPNKRMWRRSNVSSRAQRYPRGINHLSNEYVFPEDESDEEEFPEHLIRKTPPTFMGIPREIRMKIYRYLLLNEKPITVHGKWKQVHRSNSLSLPTGILSTCKIVHDEACVVLYGENVFVYLLRDPVWPARAISNLATNDDEVSSEDEDDSGSEYEDEEEDSRSCNYHRERCIDVDKYAPLFRKIVVEAEHNRYSKATQESMADAIRIFATKDDGASRDDTCNIRTLTIRVSPLWNEGDEPGAGRFTFVDFFETNAPVIQAIKAVDCQLLHVEILTKYISRQPSNSTITYSEDGSVRLTIDRRWERYHNVVRHGRAHRGVLDDRDKVMKHRMREMTNRTSVAIDELARHVEAQCNERNFHQHTTMGLALNWSNITFEEFEDMEY